MKGLINLSIIIPTIGRTDHLQNLLASIFEFSAGYNYEIIIIDQNSKGYLDNVINKFPSSNIVHANVNFKGLSKAKNFGINLAKGLWCCFPDDDSLFLHDTLSNFFKVTDRIQSDIYFGRCIDEVGADSVIKFKKQEYFLNKKNMNGGFVEATAFIKTIVAKQYLFDENMGAGCFHGAEEGYDWLYRMLSKNITAFYIPEIRFFHPQTVTSKNKNTPVALRRVFTYRCGFGYLCRKHKLHLKYLKRAIWVFCSIPFFLLYDRHKAKYYFVELLGLFAGVLIP